MKVLLVLILGLIRSSIGGDFDYLLEGIEDIIVDDERRVHGLWKIRINNIKNGPYEIGYLVHCIQERYLRMVDYYISNWENRYAFYLIEHTLALEQIERTFWEIEHMINMLHEIERKYKLDTDLHKKFVETSTITTTTTKKTRYTGLPRSPKVVWKKGKRVKLENERDFMARLTMTPKRPNKKQDMFDLLYGWELDYNWWDNQPRHHGKGK